MKEIQRKLGTSMAQVYFAKYKVTRLVERELRQLKARADAQLLACK